MFSSIKELWPRRTFPFIPFLLYDEQPEISPVTSRSSRNRSSRNFPPKTTTQTQRPTPKKEPPARKPNIMLRNSLIFIGIGMLLAGVLVLIGQSTGNWVSNTLDDFRYGNPRTYHTDVFVGHEGKERIPSHFIAVNLKGKIQVIEFPGGDATKARIYLGPQLYDLNADKIPVKLEFVDRKHDHHPDMDVVFGTSRVTFQYQPNGYKIAP